MFEIIWSERAENEYFHTLDFWISHNKSSKYSEKIIIDVEKKEHKISQNPNIGTPIKYRNARRIQILKYFSLIYKIEGNTIEILSFWDNRRNPDTLEVEIRE
jgi:plasmid stabilization system protein ParE